MTELPTYAEARTECLENDSPSALAWFITEHEGGRPGSLEEQTFRADLAAAIEEAKCQGFQEAERTFDDWRRISRQIADTSFWYGFFCACAALSIFVAIYTSFFHAGE